MRLLQSRLAIAAIAAATTVAVSGLVPDGDAVAKPVYRDDLASLRAENKRLRQDLRDVRAAADELSDGLTRIEKASRRVRDRRVKQQLLQIVRDSRERAGEHLDELEYDRDHDRDDRDDRDGYGTYAMSDRDFQALRTRVDDASFADDQLALIKTAAGTNAFTADQVVALMKACSFEDTRIEVAVMLTSRLVDPDRAYLIEDGFTYSSSKQTYRERLGR